MAVALTVANVRGAHLRAMTLWAIGSYCQFVAWMFYALRGEGVPELASALVGFSALSAGYALQFAAVVEFSGRRMRYWILGACFVLGVLMHASIFFVEPDDQRLRIIAASFDVSAWLTVSCVALLLYANDRERVSYWLTGAFFGAAAMVNAYRGLDTMFGAAPTQNLFTVNLTQTVAFGSAYVAMLGTSLGFILMTKERADAEILRIASTDALTGLLNRRTFEEAARRELARMARTNADICALMCDLDLFKGVNDTYGHPVGDLVLANFARVLRDGLRPFDIVGRYGGEEFLVLLPGTNIADALTIAERIRVATGQSSVRTGRALVTCSVSIGVTYAQAPDATLETIVKRADDALYAAKAAGRNCVRTM